MRAAVAEVEALRAARDEPGKQSLEASAVADSVAEEGALESAWLIERGQSENQTLEWWIGDPDTVTREDEEHWTRDAYEATWFGTKDAAETIIRRLFTSVLGDISAHAVEHGFAATGSRDSASDEGLVAAYEQGRKDGEAVAEAALTKERDWKWREITRARAAEAALTEARDAQRPVPTGEGGPGKEEQYWMRAKTRAAITHLRDMEDYFRLQGGTPESFNQVRADRARQLYEAITADFLNGKMTRPTVREERDSLAAALEQAQAALRAEQVRANVMEHERDFEQQVVVPSAWDKIEELTGALETIRALPCELGYSDDERDNCFCKSCFAVGIARSALKDSGASTTGQSAAMESSSSIEEGSSSAGPGTSHQNVVTPCEDADTRA